MVRGVTASLLDHPAPLSVHDQVESMYNHGYPPPGTTVEPPREVIRLP